MPVTQFDLAPPRSAVDQPDPDLGRFGIVVGLLAKALVPGRDPAGPVGTLLVGMVGQRRRAAGPDSALAPRPVQSHQSLGFLRGSRRCTLLLAAYRILTLWFFRPKEEDDSAEEDEETGNL